MLFGSESSGKTTLAAQLAVHYRAVWVPEFAREYLEAKGETCTLADIVPIAEGQLRLEREAAAFQPQLLFCDTNILETKVYSEAYFQTTPPAVLRWIEEYPYDFYLLTLPDTPWTPDGLRDRPHERAQMHQLFQLELVSRKLPFAEISGTGPQRLYQAIAAVDAFI